MSLGERALAWARLLRLSNGPTAVADVWMGYAVVSGTLEPTWSLALMSICSLCLYHAGMIGNDIADVFDDRAEGRDRPITTNAVFGWDAMRARRRLEIGALLAAGIAAWLTRLSLPFFVAAALWLVIRWYNSELKRTPAGPLLMGGCRSLNVSLGAGVAGFQSESLFVPVGIGLYTAGVTLFARDERRQQRRPALYAGLSVSFLGIAWLACWQAILPNFSDRTLPGSWPVAWTVVALITTRGMFAAILQPTPKNIGRGVGIAIQGLVVIDAVLAAFYAGPMAGLAILALLPVTMLLARWIPQT